MGNMDLNIGGGIGAIVCGGIAYAILFYLVDAENAGRGSYKLTGLALIGGGVAGNWLWNLVFRKSE